MEEEKQENLETKDIFARKVAIWGLRIAALGLLITVCNSIVATWSFFDIRKERTDAKDIAAWELVDEAQDLLMGEVGAQWVSLEEVPLTKKELLLLHQAERKLFDAKFLSPDNPQLHELIGFIRYRLGELDSAIYYVDMGFRLRKKGQGKFAIKAMILEAQQKFDEAENYYKMEIEQDPSHPINYFSLATFYARINKPRLFLIYQDSTCLMMKKRGWAKEIIPELICQ